MLICQGRVILIQGGGVWDKLPGGRKENQNFDNSRLKMIEGPNVIRKKYTLVCLSQYHKVNYSTEVISHCVISVRSGIT